MAGILVGVLVLATSIPWLAARTLTESKYVWKSGEWGSCYASNGCGEGIRERNVWCADIKLNEIAIAYYCKPDNQPARTKPCFAACRHHREHLEWRMGEWGPCLTNDGVDTDTGIMTRNVTCILTSHDRNLQKLMVIDDDNCLIVGKRPDSQRVCVLPTRQECVLTEWSEWTPCCDSTRHRTRSVVVAPHYGAQPCPQLSEWKSCDSEDSECDKSTGGTRLRVEKWGECVVHGGSLWDGESRGQADNYYKHWPQVGTQRRTVTCLNSAGTPLDPKECLNERSEIGLPMRERACIISQDCAVSEWSNWTVIQEGCVDANGVEWAEITERKREVLRLHEGQGQGCPHLTETKSTTSNLPLCSLKYHWVTSHWSSCTMPGVNGKAVCGGGLQTRNVTCVKAEGGQPIHPKFCRNLRFIETVQRCEVACPRDCEVSQWESWGPCKPHPDVCKTTNEQPRSPPRKGERKRTRTVMIAPSDLGLGCPSLEEVQPCDRPRCYIWQTAPWSSCYLNSQQSKCGSGRRTRSIKCVTHTGEPVPDSFCVELMPEAEEPCLLPCPYDCVVSAWSSWTPCSQPCSTSTSMALKSRNRTIIAPPGHEGHSCPDPDEFMQIEGCNTHGCHGYSWMTLPWQECNATCDSEGFQVREIWCAENQERVADDKCSTIKKPTEIKSCTVECPKECQVTPWSEWSECNSHLCYPNGSRGTTSKQKRYRVVLGGDNCGPLEETRHCEVRNAPCPKYSWAVGNWSDCQLAEGVICGHGLRTRDLWCVITGTERRVELRHCLATEEAIPISVERCHADCHTPCQLTEWSQWSACKQPCSGQKTRRRELIGFSSQHKTCQELKLVETTDCPCMVYYSLPLSNWSTCLTNDSEPCGTGSRYRAMGCFDNKNHQMVDPSLCGGSNGLEEEPCFITCPIDCILDEWSPWGECSLQCGPGMQNRSRNILRRDSHGGRPCGNVVETKVCNTPCDVYQWEAGGWSECNLLPSDKPMGCGTGDQYRQVRCVDTRSNIEVDEILCDWATQPSYMNPCHVACAGDCVLSPWSEWSLCPKDCSGNSQQQRTRSLLRAAGNDGAECPRSIETQSCQLNVTCFTYKWAMTNYSSCLPLGGSPCGEGVSTRTIYCLRSDGRPVSDSWCSGLSKPVSADKWCYTECPIDCEISEWSEWNSSKCHCGQTSMSRHAAIVTNPSSTGRPCPVQTQWKPCPAAPCYNWLPSAWTSCQLHVRFKGAACGHGVKTRNITCIRGNDNVTVESWHCSGVRKPSVWELCHSPCDSDCQLSNWSEWSHCHADCTKDTSGYQTRSRAVIRPAQSAGAEPCPEALWETRPCDLGPCFTFDWAVDSTGQIICQRSDGLHVIGGCSGKKKPKPTCQWQDGRCTCEDGAVVLQQTACPSEANEVQARVYYPKDDHLNVWMFAMIGIGCVFIIFVAASIYLLCHSGREVTAGGYQSTK